MVDEIKRRLEEEIRTLDYELKVQASSRRASASSTAGWPPSPS